MTDEERKRFYEMLGEKIKEARKKLDISQEAFAEYLYLSRTSVVNMEKGRHQPAIHTLFFISEILKTSLEELLPNLSEAKNQNTISAEWKKKVTKAANGNQDIANIVTGFVEKNTSRTPR